MTKLIKELKKEHKKILSTFLKLKGCSSTVHKHKEIFSIKKLLFDHLKKEDDCLYVHLLAAAERDKKLKSILDIFISHVKKITEFAIKFYNDHEILTNEEGFLYDLDKLGIELSVRIESENNILFKEYEKRFTD